MMAFRVSWHLCYRVRRLIMFAGGANGFVPSALYGKSQKLQELVTI
jgi:hypothetical protein